MDKFEYKVRAEEIKTLIAHGDYPQAAEIADTVDWRRVKSVMMLCTISDLYKINRRFEDARDMLLLAYDRHPGGRTILYSLCELSIKMEEFVQAVEYYKEFVQIAPKDTGRYVLQYKLYEAQDVGLEERTAVLEELKKRDYREKWAYELAYLYHRIGLSTRCVEECDELVLWFGEGKYVIKALELKMLHEPLSPQQQEKYDYRYTESSGFEGEARQSEGGYGEQPGYQDYQGQENQSQEYQGEEYQGQEYQGQDYPMEDDGYPEQQPYSAQQLYHNPAVKGKVIYPGQGVFQEPVKDDEMDIHVKTLDVGQYNTINLQKELAEGLKEVLGSQEAMTGNPVTRSIIAPLMDSDTESLDFPQIEEVDENYLEQEEIQESEVFFGETGEIGSLEGRYEPQDQKTAEEDVVYQEEEYIAEGNGNYQEEYIAGGNGNYQEEYIAGENGNYQEEYIAGENGNYQEEYISEEDGNYQEEYIAEGNGNYEEEYFAEDGETDQDGYEPVGNNRFEAFLEEEAESDWEESSADVIGHEGGSEGKPVEVLREMSAPAYVQDITGEIVMEQLRQEIMEPKQETAEPPKELAGSLAMESDGQISLVMPEADKIEKQITGQLNIEDILAEWERMKKGSEERRMEAVRQRVLRHTGSMFTEFDESVRDGLLEQLEGSKKAIGDIDAAVRAETALQSQAAGAAGVAAAAGGLLNQETGIGENSKEGSESVQELQDWEEAESLLGQVSDQQELEPEDFGEGQGETEPESWELEESQEGASESEGNIIEQEEGLTDSMDIEEEQEENLADTEDYEEGQEESFSDAEDFGEGQEESLADAEDFGEGQEKSLADTEDYEEGQEEDFADEENFGDELEDQEQPAESEPAKPKIRNLTKEEHELFASFIQNKSAREQLVTAIDKVSMAAYTGNVIVTGDEGMDTMTLAKNIVRNVQMTDSNFSGKIAKITGQALNQRDIPDTVSKLQNGALIIQKSSGMDKNAAEMLHKSLQQENFGMIVILEDTRKAMDKFLAKHTELTGNFNARMDVETLSNDSLVSFGVKYAREREYTIDELGVLALHTRIGDMQTSDHTVTVMEVKDILDEAIRHANKKTFSHFFDILLAKRYDEEDMIVLREKDFM